MLRYISGFTAVIMMTSCTAGKPASGNENENPAGKNERESMEKENSADAGAQTEFYPQSKYTDFECRTEADDAVGIDLDTVASDSSLPDGVILSDGVLTITKGGDYVLSGGYNGRVVINTPDEKTHIILNGVTLIADMSPIYIENADKVSLTLADETVNTVSDSANYTFEDEEGDPDAAIFSREALSINGSGTLIVNGNYDKGIFSKDSLKIISGTISVKSVGDAVKGKDCLLVKDGSITVNAGEDGLKSNKDDNIEKGYVIIEGGDINITCGDDGIHAETYLIVYDGNINIEQCYEGLEGAKVEIYGGVINVNASDDALNAASGSATNDFGFDKGNRTFPDKGNFGGGEHQEIPDDFSPDNMPNVFDSGGMPDDFEPDNMPENIPDDSTRPEMPDTKSNSGGMGGKGSFDSRGNGGFGGGNNFNEPAEEGVYLLIAGGEIILTGGNDVIDSNGTFTQTGGSVTINNPSMSVYGEPDCIIDVNGDAVISGGDFTANAAREGDVTKVFTSPYLSFTTGKANGAYDVTDQAGNIVFSGEAVGASVIVIASDKLISGEKYTLTVDGKAFTTAAE